MKTILNPARTNKFHNSISRMIPVMLLLLISITVNAQSSRSTDGSTPTALTPGSPEGSYSLSGFDNVNLYNGNLNFNLPLLSFGGRGSAGYTMVLPIERHWIAQKDEDIPNGTYSYAPLSEGWDQVKPGYGPGVMHARRAGTGRVQCYHYPPLDQPEYRYSNAVTRMTFTMPDGTEYELQDTGTVGQAQGISQCGVGGYNRGKVFASTEGEGITFVSDADIVDDSHYGTGGTFLEGNGDLHFRDGTLYRIVAGRVTFIRDRNGNLINFAYDTNNRVTTITDSLNRHVDVAYDVAEGGQYGTCDKITFKGFGGAERVIRVSKTSMGNVLQSGNSLQTSSYLFPGLTGNTTTNFNPTVTSTVWLPNGQSFGFKYNSYGELARVNLPTGGAFEYDYQGGLSNGNAQGVVCFNGDPSQIYRRVTERRVFSDATTLESRTTYSRPESGESSTCANTIQTTGYVIVSTYDASSSTPLQSSKHYFMGGGSAASLNWSNPLGYHNWSDGKESQIDTLDTDGTTVLRMVVNTWDHDSSSAYINPHITETDATIEPAGANLVSKQTFAYDQYNNQTDIYEYDFGATNPSRHSQTAYLTTNPANSNIDYTVTSIHLRSLPVRQSVYDAGGVERARTTYEYDNYSDDTHNHPLIDRSSISGLDSGFTTSNTKRGNLTSTTRYLLTNGSVASSITAYAQYDIAGNTVKAIDFNGNATTFDFSDKFGSPDGNAQANTAPSELGSLTSYALVTSVTNALNQTSYAQYDYYLGRPVDGEDINGVVSSGYYYDNLDRPTQIIRAVSTPLKNQTTFEYNDDDRIITTTSDQVSYSDNKLKSQTLYDKLGRTIESRQYENASGNYISVKQIYDALGRKSQVSNPYRPWNSETAIYTTTTYDVLSRVAKVTTPDSAEINTYYSGAQVLVKDQAGRERMSQMNALGQLTDVWEITLSDDYTVSVTFPGHSEVTKGYLTHYDYDTLSNLTTVTQRIGSNGTTQTRSFSYDSLKRLTSATNPENGTINYLYDHNGNLTQRSDGRIVSGTTHLQTNYTYDVLNRPTSRTYNDNTPAVTYTYDGAGIANSKGRLTSVSSSVSTTNYAEFDALGHVTISSQKTNTDSISGPNTTLGNRTYTMNYSYNLAGQMTSEIYPSGRVMKMDYDVAGRITGVSGQKGTQAQQTYASIPTALSYTAHGAIAQMTLGNGKYEHTNFNNRLQPTEIGLGTTQGGTDVLKLNYDYGTTNNNGNVQSQTITVPTLNQSIVQSYAYDQLNRLQSAVETGGGGSGWSQTYGYDRFGNRAVTAGYIPNQAQTPQQITSFDAQTNRISNHNYDAVGNQTSDSGLTYAYDAENRLASYTGTYPSQGSYGYDGDGKRVKKATNSGTSIYIYDVTGEMVAEYADSTQLTQNVTSYLTTDTLGSTRLITGSDGTVKARYDYLPFGEEIYGQLSGRSTSQGYDASNDDTVREKFTGKERDKETGLDYFGARYYSSEQGRFTSVDSAGTILTTPQGLNKYQYCLNNPLRYVDRNGLYNRDVHYDLTRLLALAAGFSDSMATSIATADQRVDDDPNTSPIPNRKGLGYSRRKNYHFTTNERRKELFAKFEASGSADDLGVFLHAHQDSYSHSGYNAMTGQVTLNQWPGEWDDADDTWRDVPKADEMARTSFDWLVCAGPIMDHKGTAKVGPSMPWSAIYSYVHDFNSASTPEEKQYILGMMETRIHDWYKSYWKRKLKKAKSDRQIRSKEGGG